MIDPSPEFPIVCTITWFCTLLAFWWFGNHKYRDPMIGTLMILSCCFIWTAYGSVTVAYIDAQHSQSDIEWAVVASSGVEQQMGRID